MFLFRIGDLRSAFAELVDPVSQLFKELEIKENELSFLVGGKALGLGELKALIPIH